MSQKDTKIKINHICTGKDRLLIHNGEVISQRDTRVEEMVEGELQIKTPQSNINN